MSIDFTRAVIGIGLLAIASDALAQVPQEIRDTVAAHRHVSKEQYIESQRALNAAGLAVPHWPVEWGGKDWTPLQLHIWREEMQLACVPEPVLLSEDARS